MSLATHLASLVQTVAADIKSLRKRACPRGVDFIALASRRRLLAANTSQSLSTQASAVNRVWLVPFVAADMPAITYLSVYVSTASSSLMSLAIFSNTRAGGLDSPAEMLRVVTGLSAATVGEKSGAITPSITLVPGEIYWAAIWTAASPGLRSFPSSVLSPLLGLVPGDYVPITGIYTTSTTGMPETFTMGGYTFTNWTGNVPALIAGFN